MSGRLTLICSVGGEVEGMSRGRFLSPPLRTGTRIGDTKLIDTLVATLTVPFDVSQLGQRLAIGLNQPDPMRFPPLFDQ